LRDTRPKAFLLENVFGLAYKNNKDGMDFMLSEFDKLGYHTTIKVINMAKYGVPQTRQRLIIIGMRKDYPAFRFPEHTHVDPEAGVHSLELFDEKKPKYMTAREAFKGLANDWVETPKELIVGGKWGHLLADIPPGDNYLFYTAKKGHPDPLFEWRSRFWSFLLKLSPDKPSWTIQAQPGPYVGPFHWEGRRLTLEEKKRIQTFPDNFKFYGKRGSVQKQIGNAVPAKMGEVLGSAIIEHLEKHASLLVPEPDLDVEYAPSSRKILAEL
jgi:DNA (cytosine-5)-methyltransferase 1